MKKLSLNKKFLFLTLFTTVVCSARAEDNAIQAAEKLLVKIPFFNKIADAENNYEYWLDGKCKASESLAIRQKSQLLIDGFLSVNSSLKNQDLSEEEDQLLKSIVQRGIPPSFYKENLKGCANQIVVIEKVTQFFSVLFQKGLSIQVNSWTKGMLNKKLMSLAQENQLINFMSSELFVLDRIRHANPSLVRDSGLALFLHAKVYDEYAVVAGLDREAVEASLQRIAFSYRRFNTILNVVLNAAQSSGSKLDANTLDYLQSYEELRLIETSPENRLALQNGRVFNTTAYVSTLLRMSKLFPELIRDTAASKKSFSALSAAEKIAKTYVSQGYGTRDNLMSFVTIADNNVDHTKVFDKVSDELRSSVWVSREKKISSSERSQNRSLADERYILAAQVLRITGDVIKLYPNDLTKALAVCGDIRNQLVNGQDVALVKVSAPTKSGI